MDRIDALPKWPKGSFNQGITTKITLRASPITFLTSLISLLKSLETKTQSRLRDNLCLFIKHINHS
jgi:hypothetical protein